MNWRRLPLSFALFIGLCSFVSTETASADAANPPVILSTPANIRFGLWPAAPSHPAPTLFIFATTIEATLGDPYYRQCGNALAEQGYLCVSLDLPCHGPDQRPGEPAQLEGWRHRCEAGEDFVTPFTAQVRSVLDYLIAEGYTDPERVAVCGTSRGGFMALQVAAADTRFKAVAAFAPVTALSTLNEFQGAETNPLVQSLSLLPRANTLAGRAIWIVIGDQDERVGTDDAIAFARAVTGTSLERGVPSRVELHVLPEPRGHTVPAGAVEMATAWVLRQLTKQ